MKQPFTTQQKIYAITNIIGYLFIGSLLALSLTSCGIRKVEKQLTESNKVENTETVSTENTHTEIKNDILNTELEITPIDSSKEIEVTSYDGKVTKYKNAKISHKNTIDKSTLSQFENTESNIISNKKEDNKSSFKHIDKKNINIWWLFLLIFPIGYWILKKFYYI